MKEFIYNRRVRLMFYQPVALLNREDKWHILIPNVQIQSQNPDNL